MRTGSLGRFADVGRGCGVCASVSVGGVACQPMWQGCWLSLEWRFRHGKPPGGEEDKDHVERPGRRMGYARPWSSGTARATALRTWLGSRGLDRLHLRIGDRVPSIESATVEVNTPRRARGPLSPGDRPSPGSRWRCHQGRLGSRRHDRDRPCHPGLPEEAGRCGCGPERCRP